MTSCARRPYRACSSACRAGVPFTSEVVVSFKVTAGRNSSAGMGAGGAHQQHVREGAQGTLAARTEVRGAKLPHFLFHWYAQIDRME